MSARIVFDSVRKTFRRRNRSDSLRDALPRALGRLIGRNVQATPPFVALDDVSFEVGEGEVLGIVGGNGAGKSTSLRLAAGVYRPDGGSVQVDGRISALIELSAGFHPDLSGRENIHLVGALHGLRRREVAAKIGAISEFADIGEFLDAPVRTYSTGMAVRLGFSVAVHVPAEVLLVDEVLAVGDAEFRTKCLRLMARRRDEGVTVIFVSHNLAIMEQFCDRVIFLHHGRVLADGPPRTVIAQYLSTVAAERRAQIREGSRAVPSRRGTHEFKLDDVVLDGGPGTSEGEVAYRGALRVRARWAAQKPITGVRLRLHVHSAEAVLCGTALAVDLPEMFEGEGSLEVVVPSMDFLPGAYDVTIEAHDATGLVVLDQHDRLHALTVSGERPAGAQGIVEIASSWRVAPDAAT